ncbi:MAG: HAD family hydrolase [Terrimicrobiaceae bacterium]|nr:HAD family hydrolase [Terrimicrobiaceae bacterium]
MKWRALATDFDGTIATDGMVDAATQEALRGLRESGLALILVTGRVLRDFEGSPGVLQLFDAVVAENGAVAYDPAAGSTRLLANAPPAALVDRLATAGVPLALGDVILSTIEPYEVTVLETIKDLALEHQVIFNKGAVMVLPAGVNKATGLAFVLREFGFAPGDVIGVGDAENDAAFLDACGFSVAVANALPALRERAAHVTRSNAGAGVAEFAKALLAGEIATGS